MGENKFTLTVGDWSNDGHGQTDVFSVSSNYTSTQVSKAHDAACKEFGLDFDSQCEEYEDHWLDIDFWNRYQEVFAGNEEALNCFDDGPARSSSGPYVCSDEFAEMYLHIAKLELKDLEWKFDTHESDIQIGGYGLFE